MTTTFVPLSRSRKRADMLVAGFFEGEGVSKALASLEPEFAKRLKYAVEKGKFKGAFCDSFSEYGSENREAPDVAVIGLGKRKKFEALCFRKAAGRIVHAAKGAKAKKVKVLLESFTASGVSMMDAAGIFSEMTLLSFYDFDRYKSSANSKQPKSVPHFEFLVSKSSLVKPAQKKAEASRAIAEGVLLTRDLINEPGNVMHPQKLAQEARRLAVKKKLACKILTPAEIKKHKMGGVLAVNQGSKTPPAFIILEHGRSYKKKGTVCLVGKGVTFDTGGISIKPSKDMEKMKYDMSGGAAVIGTMGAVADLKLKAHVVGIVPAVENMVAEDPQRPGDIIRISNGKTVEVLNTDAEGRLILADALVYTEKYKPKAVIDLATLTGMCVYTFGDQCCAILGNDDKLISRVQKAGNRAGERCWQLPLWEEYGEQLKGYHSDLLNIGGPYGGTITAAMFLKEFVPAKTPWVHLDIAGMAWANSARYDCAKGATGFGVKLLAELLSQWA